MSLQRKYDLIQAFYWMTYCAIYGYVAVLLQYKGMSNTLIGVTTGLTCALTMFSTPLVSGLVGKKPHLTLRRLIMGNYLATALLWLALNFIPMPQAGLLVLFVLCGNLCAVNTPLVTMICMNYMAEGHDLNFGLSRGLGSLAYASSAAAFGLLIERFNPSVLGLIFLAGTAGLFAVLMSLPPAKRLNYAEKKKALSMPAFARKYKKYILILAGIALQFAAATALSTYLINIVKSLGGTTSLYGVALFCMAASELPFMAIVPSLKRHLPTEALLLFSSVLYVARNVIIASAGGIGILLFGMSLQGLSFGIFTASVTYYVKEVTDFEDGMMGQTMIAVMTSGLGSTIGNVFGGALQDAFGLGALLSFAKILTLAGFLIVAIVIVSGARRQRA